VELLSGGLTPGQFIDVHFVEVTELKVTIQVLTSTALLAPLSAAHHPQVGTRHLHLTFGIADANHLA
jgi:hypothetical protein